MVDSYGAVLDAVTDQALGDLSGMFAQLNGLDYPQFREGVIDLSPTLLAPHGELVSATSATFYEEARAIQGVKGNFQAEGVVLQPTRIYPAAGAATSATLWDQGLSAMYSFLAGAVTSALSELAADVIAENAALDDRNSVRYQRYPRPGCCAFCSMLASRGAAYESKESALRVVGRGVPVPSIRRRGGQGKGVGPRGSRALGEKFHDHCRCRAVPLSSGTGGIFMEAVAENHFGAYEAAYKHVSKGQQWIPGERNADGGRTTKGRWVDADGNTRTNDQKVSAILAFMREQTGMR